MDLKGTYGTRVLTHVLIDHAGWIPVEGKPVDEEFESDQAWFEFISDKRTIIVNRSRIVAFKYAEAKR